MKNFSEIKEGAILYVLNNITGVEEIIIKSIQALVAFKTQYAYDVCINFVNDMQTTYRLTIEKRYDDQEVILTKIYTENCDRFKNPENPYYLIATNKPKLIEYYIEQLNKSIAYQQEVVNEGQDQIKKLQDLIKQYKEML